MGFASEDDEMHVHATMLPSGPPTAASTNGSAESEPAAAAALRASTRASANPFTPAPTVNAQNAPPPPTAQSKTPMVLPAAAATPEGDEFIRVSEYCNATRCLRLQWEAEMNPRCLAKTTITSNGHVYIFDGFSLLCHGEPPPVPQFEYTRGGVMCKLQFVVEDTPALFRLPPRTESSSSTAAAAAAGGDPRADHCHRMFLLQRYLFSQLLRIQPVHLFMKIFPDAAHASGDAADICSDYHIVPRFIAVDQQPLLNKPDLLAPHRIGFAAGNLLALDKILLHLEESAKFTAAAFVMQFEARQLVDIVISTRVNGTTPGAFRVDALVFSEAAASSADASVVSKDGKAVVAIEHRGDGAWHYDGAKSKKKIRKWQELGAFVQLSPQVDPVASTFQLHECHLTGLRSDIFEVGSAMPMALKHIRHCLLLTSFEASMGLAFADKSLLRQAFTHGSYVDVGMQSVNTWEATFSRVHLGHVFENTAQLKRSRSRLYEAGSGSGGGGNAAAAAMDPEMKAIAALHLSASEFKEEFHSKFLCPYERLEFLGDAVLGFLVASSTFLKLPTAGEGFLHQTRVDMVNNENLGKIARTANLESLLLSAFDLAALREDVKAKIVADCFEALLGALFKDQGIAPCRALLGKLLSLHDDELRELIFLSTDEVAELAAGYIEADRPAIQGWSKLPEARLRHRLFTTASKVEIRNTHLWLQCMTHNSFKAPQIPPDEFVGADPSYERIEFLGDAVLQLLASAFLVDAFPYYQEHLLTQVRSSLVKNTRLAVVARDAGYENFLRLGSLVRQPGSNLYVEDVLADTFEATLGAVFLENPGDLSKVNAVLERSVFPVVKEAIRQRKWMNPRKVLAHHLEQWTVGSRPVECKFKAIKTGEEGHAVALYVNNFL
ncbi:hypothetical protein PybrP1_009353 [[Pythium] brassicae (nom. inval.)]|nr:hypothetical protein PybrP1_009353 [[Pythium] brassicae (nom. inval.)]